MRRLLRGCLILVVLSGIAVLGAWLAWGRVRTPSIPGSEAVATLEPVTLGGIEQWILVRGQSRKAPILLFLHGGPGMPAMYLHHAFGRSLEEDFLVVHWDQRGAGKSYSPELDPGNLSVERVLGDALELVALLRDRYDPGPIVLVGHSWGSYLGAILTHRYPELFRAWVAVGQVTDPEREAALAEEFIRSTARRLDRPEAISELDDHGEEAHERWLFRFGGELHGKTNFLPLLLTGLRAPEYSWEDALNVARGSSWSSAHMEWNALDGPLMEEILTFELPVYLFQGRHDRVTPSLLVREYARRLDAPRKKMVWFEESAHFPFFEQPSAFAREMRNVLRETSHEP